MEKQSKMKYKGKKLDRNLPPSALLTEDCFMVSANKQYLDLCVNEKEQQS